MAQLQFGVAAEGGRLSTPHLSKMLRYRAQPLMRIRHLAEPMEGGKNTGRGDTLYFSKVGDITVTGSSLVESSTIPSGKPPITQGSVIMAEWGFQVPFTGKLNTLSEYDVKKLINKTLTNHAAKTLERAAGTAATSRLLKFSCTASGAGMMTTNGTFGATASFQMNDNHVKDVVDFFNNNSIPPFDSQGNYMCVATVPAMRGLRDVLESTLQYTDEGMKAKEGIGIGRGLSKVPGELGKLYNVRFALATSFLATNVGTSTNKGEALFFGGDALKEFPAINEEIRVKVPQDYDRDQGIAWYAMTAFVAPWLWSDDAQESIVHLGSL